jgi:hypothetical protein
MTAGFSWRKFQIRNRGLIGIKRLMNRNHLVSLHILIIGNLCGWTPAISSIGLDSIDFF